LDGTLSKNGNMTHFVAENLEYKIKISSPVSRKDDSGSGTPINAMSRQFFNSSQFDSNVLSDIENEAHYLASSVDNLTENLCNILHSVRSAPLFIHILKVMHLFILFKISSITVSIQTIYNTPLLLTQV
jgi:hypothetical protein